MRSLRELWRHDKAAVAPTVALSLFGLIAAGGLAFDYSRVAAMDTELQAAADQAALAAATQLDRYDDSQARATAAITASGNQNRLAANFTRFANDDEGATVEVTLTFCETFDDDIADTMEACDPTTDGELTRFVVVTTETRVANYALTPIVAAFSSGPIQATAVAGIEASICNIAPLFVCTADANFPTDEDIGRGLLLKTGAQNSWAPGNYGFLDFGPGNPGVIDALLGHGLNGCQTINETNTQPGNKNATDAINTRLDVYAGQTGDPTEVCDVLRNTPGVTPTGAGCPAFSARKDMVVKLEVTANNSTSSTPPAPAACPTDPVAAGETYELPASPVQGFPRDTCHFSTCPGGNFGDANWDRAAYFAQNHTAADLAAAATFAGKTSAELTRYDVYKWELDSPTARMTPKSFVTTTSEQKQNLRWNHTVTTQCTYSQPLYGSTAYPEQKDRRILPIIAANCSGLNGVGTADEDFQAIRVFDVFITEPSGQRTYPGVTDEKEIYGEVIGPAESAQGGSGFQYYSKSKPYLVR